jgi:hypothetical protein
MDGDNVGGHVSERARSRRSMRSACAPCFFSLGGAGAGKLTPASLSFPGRGPSTGLGSATSLGSATRTSKISVAA